LEQQQPKVAGFSSGNFVVTWQSYGQDGSFYGVYNQIFRDNITAPAITGSTASSGSTGLTGSTGSFGSTGSTGSTGILSSSGTSASTLPLTTGNTLTTGSTGISSTTGSSITSSSGGFTTGQSVTSSSSSLTTSSLPVTAGSVSSPSSSETNLVWLWGLLGGLGTLCLGIGAYFGIVRRRAREDKSLTSEELTQRSSTSSPDVEKARSGNQKYGSVAKTRGKDRNYGSVAAAPLEGNIGYGTIPPVDSSSSGEEFGPDYANIRKIQEEEYGPDYANVPKIITKKRDKKSH